MIKYTKYTTTHPLLHDMHFLPRAHCPTHEPCHVSQRIVSKPGCAYKPQQEGVLGHRMLECFLPRSLGHAIRCHPFWHRPLSLLMMPHLGTSHWVSSSDSKITITTNKNKQNPSQEKLSQRKPSQEKPPQQKLPQQATGASPVP